VSYESHFYKEFMKNLFVVIMQVKPIRQFTNCYEYKIQYDDDSCRRASIAPEDLSLCFMHRSRFNRKNTHKTVLMIMATAVRKNGSSYQFSKLFADSTRGYEIHQVNGTFADEMCQWNVYIDSNKIPSSTRNIFNCIVKAGQTLSLRYEGNATMTTTNSATPSDSSTTAASTPPVTDASTGDGSSGGAPFAIVIS